MLASGASSRSYFTIQSIGRVESFPFPAGDRRRQTTMGFTNCMSASMLASRSGVAVVRRTESFCRAIAAGARSAAPSNNFGHRASRQPPRRAHREQQARELLPDGYLPAKRSLATTRTTGQTWDVVPTRARLHTVRDWQRAVDKVVVCRPSRSRSTATRFQAGVAPLLPCSIGSIWNNGNMEFGD